MRRPSWNKSQAIQQVISLKALLESGDDSGAGALRKVLASHSPTPRPKNVVPASLNSADSANEDADESALFESKEPAESAPLGEISCRAVEYDNKCFSPRSLCEANELGGQMTIFYCGKVNVYDGVPPDKARALMHLAASPMELPQDNPHNVNPDLRSIVCYLQADSDKLGVVPSTAINSHVTQPVKLAEYPQQIRERDKGNIARDPDIDGQASRKMSLQRYLEKRKDRGRLFKSRKSSGQPSNMEMYSNDQTKTQNSNGQSGQSNSSSPTMSGLPNALCTSDLGVLYWKLNPKDYENDEELKKIRADRGYSYMDLLDLHPEKVTNYEEKLKNFYTEHIHADEERRYFLEGSGYFDVCGKDDCCSDIGQTWGSDYFASRDLPSLHSRH